MDASLEKLGVESKHTAVNRSESQSVEVAERVGDGAAPEHNGSVESRASSLISVSDSPGDQSILDDVELAPASGRWSINFGGRAEELVDLLHPITSVPDSPVTEPERTTEKDASQHTLLNIVIQVVGTRGDVQPFLPLAHELRRFGHRVRIATHAIFQQLVEGEGLEFFCIGGDSNALMAFMVKNPSLLPSMATVRDGDISKRRRDMAEILQGCWRSCIEAGNGLTENDSETLGPFVADAIIANPPSFAHLHCAEKLAIPVHMMFTMPWTPTTAFAHPLAKVKQGSDDNPASANYISYLVMDMMTWQGLGDLVNDFREKSLGLEPVGAVWMATLPQKFRIPFTYCWSPALIPKPRDWGSHISVSGFNFLDVPTNYTPQPELSEFLSAGPPPVYIGFGSIVLDDPDTLTRTVYAAIQKSGARALLSRGSGGLGNAAIEPPPNVLLLDDCPHSWLFQRVAAVVHHGGAGTTAAGLAAGNPTVIVPFFGDQHFWGDMVARAGAGPKPIGWKDLTIDNLTDALSFALKTSTKSAALKLAARIQSENGAQMGVQHFHGALPSARMTCTLDPRRTAVWTTKRSKSKLRLSAVSAALLVREGLVRVEDLVLYRAVEYEVDPGPWEPVTASLGIAMGILSNFTQAFGNLAWGLATESGQPNGNAKRLVKAHSTGLDAGDARAPALDTASNTTRANTAPSSNRFRRTKRGLISLSTATARMPMDYTVKTAQGLNNLPRLYDDQTVRPAPRVTGIQSGLKASGTSLALGVYDGIAGIVTQPVRVRHEGGVAIAAGVAKGIGGALFKPIAGVSGFFGYAMKGVQREFQKAGPKGIKVLVRSARLDQGAREVNEMHPGEREQILRAWKELDHDGITV